MKGDETNHRSTLGWCHEISCGMDHPSPKHVQSCIHPRTPTTCCKGGWGGFGGSNHLLRIWFLALTDSPVIRTVHSCRLWGQLAALLPSHRAKTQFQGFTSSHRYQEDMVVEYGSP